MLFITKCFRTLTDFFDSGKKETGDRILKMCESQWGLCGK